MEENAAIREIHRFLSLFYFFCSSVTYKAIEDARLVKQIISLVPLITIYCLVKRSAYDISRQSFIGLCHDVAIILAFYQELLPVSTQEHKQRFELTD